MVNTLVNFGVPIDGSPQGPLRQPKLKYRFTVTFLNFGSLGNTAQDVTLNIESATLPTIKHEDVAVHSYNSIAYYAGKASYDTVDLTLRDDVLSTGMRQVGSQLQRQMDHYNQTGYRSATDYKFTTIISGMDGSNTGVLDTWTGEGCFIVSSNFADLSYADGGAFRTIKMTIRADNWTLTDSTGATLMATPSSDPQGSTL